MQQTSKSSDDKEILNIGHPYIFRFRTNSERTIDEIVNNYIFFADRNSLNDPFDSNPELVKLTKNCDEIKKLYSFVRQITTDEKTLDYLDSEYSAEDLQIFAQEKIADYISSFGIACFSMYIMNMPLWANYASNHNGVCLQFNSNLDSDFFKNLAPVNYQKDLEEIEFMPISDVNQIGKFFFKKEVSWSYEKEVRLLKDSIGKLKYDKKSLRNVILGYNAKDDYVEKIFQAVKNNYNNVGVYQLEKPSILGKLTLYKIE